MKLEKINKNTLIVLIIVSIILLSTIVSGYFLWFKNKDMEAGLNQQVDTNALKDKFNLNLFQDKNFQDLKDTPGLNTSTNENLGKENPFLEFEQ
ncbi:MAG TPA: hypothetical protein PLK76_00135 [bacterium]|nr:hypothetical protein [bacterium]